MDLRDTCTAVGGVEKGRGIESHIELHVLDDESVHDLRVLDTLVAFSEDGTEGVELDVSDGRGSSARLLSLRLRTEVEQIRTLSHVDFGRRGELFIFRRRLIASVLRVFWIAELRAGQTSSALSARRSALLMMRLLMLLLLHACPCLGCIGVEEGGRGSGRGEAHEEGRRGHRVGRGRHRSVHGHARGGVGRGREEGRGRAIHEGRRGEEHPMRRRREGRTEGRSTRHEVVSVVHLLPVASSSLPLHHLLLLPRDCSQRRNRLSDPLLWLEVVVLHGEVVSRRGGGSGWTGGGGGR